MIKFVDYSPRPKQQLFHASGAQDLLFGGAKSPGKSCALTMEAAAYAMEWPGSTPYLFRRTYDDLEANLIQEFLKRMPAELYSWDKMRHEATLKNGSVIKFRHISSLEDAYAYNGRSIPWIGVDELTEHLEQTVQILRSCNRSAEGFPVRFRATANPGNIGHVHVYKRYVAATDYGKNIIKDPVDGQTIQFIPANVYDGVLAERDPAYVKRLENLPEVEKQAYLYGNWDILAGQFFKVLSRDAHIIGDRELPRDWLRWRSLDWGHAHAAVCLWWASSPDGELIIYRAAKRNGVDNPTKISAVNFAREMVQIGKDSMDEELIQVTVGSPDLWTPLKEEEVYTGNLISNMMVEAGLSNLRKAVNARVPGWEYCRQIMEYDRAADGTITKYPRLRIMRNCEWVYDDLHSRIHDPKKPEDLKKMADDADDTVDAMRYGAIHDKKTEVAEDETTKSDNSDLLVCGRA